MRHGRLFLVHFFRHHERAHGLAQRRVVGLDDGRAVFFVDGLGRVRLGLAHDVDILGQQRLVQVRVAHVQNLHVLARFVGPGQLGLGQFGKQQDFLRTAARDTDFLAFQVGNALDVQVRAADDLHAALGEAAHQVHGQAGGAARDGRFQRAGGHVDFAGDHGRHDVEALGEDALFDLQVVFRRDFLHVGNGAVMGEFQVAQTYGIGCVDGQRELRGQGDGHGQCLGVEKGRDAEGACHAVVSKR
ncbi:hypothetical protein D3C72_1329770 [compost metagenome]